MHGWKLTAGGLVMMQEFSAHPGLSVFHAIRPALLLGNATVVDNFAGMPLAGRNNCSPECYQSAADTEETDANPASMTPGTMALFKTCRFTPAIHPLHRSQLWISNGRLCCLYMLTYLSFASYRGDVTGDGREDVFMGGAKLRLWDIFRSRPIWLLPPHRAGSLEAVT